MRIRFKDVYEELPSLFAALWIANMDLFAVDGIISRILLFGVVWFLCFLIFMEIQILAENLDYMARKKRKAVKR